MNAENIVLTHVGGRGAFSFEPFEPADPGEGELRIAVRAIGVNFADIFCRLGLYAAAPPVPFTPGFEVAGIVEAVGADVHDFRVGDRVLAVTRFKGYTTHLVIEAERTRPLPSGWSFEEGAAFPVAALTAWYGLVHLGRVREGNTVVITAAAGGVGGVACALARARGARVLGAVGSAEKRDAAFRAGAHDVLVSRRYGIWNEVSGMTDGRGVDVVLDAVGGSQLHGAYRALAPDGRLVLYGFADMMPSGVRRPWLTLLWRAWRTPKFPPFDLVQKNRSVAGFNLVYLWDRLDVFRQGISELFALAEHGVLRPRVGHTFPFRDIAKAQGLLQSRQSTGKVVLTVGAPEGSGETHTPSA